jgi:hypothetical protein
VALLFLALALRAFELFGRRRIDHARRVRIDRRTCIRKLTGAHAADRMRRTPRLASNRLEQAIERQIVPRGAGGPELGISVGVAAVLTVGVVCSRLLRPRGSQ